MDAISKTIVQVIKDLESAEYSGVVAINVFNRMYKERFKGLDVKDALLIFIPVMDYKSERTQDTLTETAVKIYEKKHGIVDKRKLAKLFEEFYEFYFEDCCSRIKKLRAGKKISGKRMVKQYISRYKPFGTLLYEFNVKDKLDRKIKALHDFEKKNLKTRQELGVKFAKKLKKILKNEKITIHAIYGKGSTYVQNSSLCSPLADIDLNMTVEFKGGDPNGGKIRALRDKVCEECKKFWLETLVHTYVVIGNLERIRFHKDFKTASLNCRGVYIVYSKKFMSIIRSLEDASGMELMLKMKKP